MESETLKSADDIIHGERQDQYGSPEDSFKIIADFWTPYLKHRFGIDIELNSLDTAHMMVLFKMARMLGQQTKKDNYIDAAGYIAIAGDRLLPSPEKKKQALITYQEPTVINLDVNKFIITDEDVVAAKQDIADTQKELGLDDVAPAIKDLISESLCIDRETIDMSDSFKDLGADSLEHTELVMSAEEKFDVDINDNESDGAITVDEMAHLVKSKLISKAFRRIGNA